MSIQSLNWDAMINMVDWDSTAQFIQNTSAEARKDIILAFASSFTKSELKTMKESEIKHKMLYMSLVSTTVLDKNEKSARVKVLCRLEKTGDKNKSDVTLELRKVNREWKVILTPDILQRKN